MLKIQNLEISKEQPERKIEIEPKEFTENYQRTIKHLEQWFGVKNISPTEAAYIKTLVKKIMSENKQLVASAATPVELKTGFFMENKTIRLNWQHLEREVSLRWLKDMYSYEPNMHIRGEYALPERSFFVTAKDGTIIKEFEFNYPEHDSEEEKQFFSKYHEFLKSLDSQKIQYKTFHAPSSKLQQEIQFVREQMQNL